MTTTEELTKPLAVAPVTPHSSPTIERMEATLALAEAALASAERDFAAPVRPEYTALAVSVLMPVYNERETIREIVERVRTAGKHTELVIVDDCSTDGTRDVLIELEQTLPGVKVILHGYNKGKGGALKTAMLHATGDVLLIQDADLEYDPADYAQLLAPIERGEADVVFGSRFLANPEQDPSFLHRLGNRLLTGASNLMTGLRITDMETCYKVFRRDVLRGMTLRENRFGFEPEFTAKLARRKCRIQEVPVSYHSRGFHEGKKIGMKDALRALYCITRYAWWD